MEYSVVVCAYNECKTVEACIESLVHQYVSEDLNYEIIIIDDGSTDETGEIVKRFISSLAHQVCPVRYFKIKHMGLSVARNIGAVVARGHIVCYVDADAEADPYYLCNLACAWRDNKEVDVIGGNIKIRNDDKVIARFLDTVLYSDMNETGIIGANMSFRREIIIRAGGFGDCFISRGDENFFLHKLGPDRVVRKELSAVVYHDVIDSIQRWFRERMAGGRMSRRLAQLIPGKYKELLFLYFRQFLGLLLLFFLGWFNFLCAFVVLLLWLLLVFCMKRNEVLRCIHVYGLVRGMVCYMVWVFLNKAGMLFHCFGFFSTGRLSEREIKRAWEGTMDEGIILEAYSTS